MSATLELARQLIALPSVTPDDAGCQEVLGTRLIGMGFELEPMPFEEVSNLWARRGKHHPLVCFAGHTDVVPAGPEANWQSPPFDPTVREGTLYGRGSADMKGALAAMVMACERFIASHGDHAGSIAFLLTSDEEGPAVNGTRRVVETLQSRRETIDYCVVGEPSSNGQLGDTIRVGRRGSLHGRLRLHGTQGHVAFPEKATNPIYAIGPVICAMRERQWGEANEFFPATTLEISNIRAGTGALNVIPGELEMDFNFRFGDSVTREELEQEFAALLDARGLRYELEWTLMGKPFLTRRGRLVEASLAAVEDITGLRSDLSTGGGTSDGRFIAPTGAEVVEIGLLNASIHQVDEATPVEDLDRLTQVYERLLEILLT